MIARGNYARTMLDRLGEDCTYTTRSYANGPAEMINVHRIRSQSLGTNLSLVLLAIATMHDAGYSNISAALVFPYVACSKSTAARHMKTLAELGYLTAWKGGRVMWYKIDWPALA